MLLLVGSDPCRLWLGWTSQSESKPSLLLLKQEDQEERNLQEEESMLLEVRQLLSS